MFKLQHEMYAQKIGSYKKLNIVILILASASLLLYLMSTLLDALTSNYLMLSYDKFNVMALLNITMIILVIIGFVKLISIQTGLIKIQKEIDPIQVRRLSKAFKVQFILYLIAIIIMAVFYIFTWSIFSLEPIDGSSYYSTIAMEDFLYYLGLFTLISTIVNRVFIIFSSISAVKLPEEICFIEEVPVETTTNSQQPLQTAPPIIKTTMDIAMETEDKIETSTPNPNDPIA